MGLTVPSYQIEYLTWWEWGIPTLAPWWTFFFFCGHKWSTTHRVLKLHISKMGIMYIESWKQWALLVINTMTLATHVLGDMYSSCVQVHELQQSRRGDRLESTLLSWFMNTYIYIYIYIYSNLYYRLRRSYVNNENLLFKNMMF